jgi:hypothetical protein
VPIRRGPLLLLVPKARPPYLKTMAHTFQHKRMLTPDKAPAILAEGEVALVQLSTSCFTTR